MFVGNFLRHQFIYTLLAGVLLASIFLAVSLSVKTAVGGQSAYTSKTAVMQQLVTKTNDLRQKNSLRPLIASEQLENSAKAKLDNMGAVSYWGHYAPDGTSFSSFIWNEDKEASSVGENLARCFDSYEAAFDGLVNSPAHYKVMTGNFTDIGVASEITANGCESIVMHVSN